MRARATVPGAALVALVALATLAACGSGDAKSESSPAPDEAGAPPGADEACPAPGYRAATDPACVTGGYATCWAGTKPRADGWGCDPIVSATSCTGATREVIGETGCVPVGDCDAPFPPAQATYFVSPQAATDATHFTTVVEALAAAPAGAVIAVDSGAYPDTLLVTKDVTLVGRCPAKTTIGETGRVFALRVEGARAEVRGLTVRRSRVGVSLGVGASAKLEDVIVDRTTLSAITLSDGGSSIELTRVVARDAQPGGDGRAPGLNLQAGSKAVVRDSVFAGNTAHNVRVASNSEATFENVVIRDGKPSSSYDIGRGISVLTGAKVSVTRAVLLDNYEVGIVAGDDSTVELHDVLVARTKLAASGEFGRALNAFGAATLRGEGVHMNENHDASVMADGAGTTVSLKRSTVIDTRFNRDGYVGRALTAQAGAVLTFEDSAVVGSREVALAVFQEGSLATLRRSIVTSTAPNAGDYFGHGVMATLGGNLIIEDSEVSSSASMGIAIGAGSARLTRVRVRANQVGLYVRDGVTLREVASGDAVPGPNEVTVSTDSLFVANETRVSAGVLPLPEPSTVLAP